MSHIVSFRIDGLAGRSEPLELTLNRDVNIVFGLNGSGKTSLLKILNSAMEDDASLLTRVPFTTAEVRVSSVRWDTVFTMTTSAPERADRLRRSDTGSIEEQTEAPYRGITFGPTETAARPWSTSPEEPERGERAPWRHFYLPTHRLSFTADTFPAVEYASRYTPLSEDSLDAIFTSRINALWSYFSAQVLGSVRSAQERGLARILGTAMSAGANPKRDGSVALPASTAYERLRTFLKRQHSEKILGSQKAFTKQYEANPTLQNIARGIDSIEDEIEEAMISRNRLEELVALLFSGHKKVRFRDESIDVLTSSGDAIGLGSLSSGEKHLLLIFVHCLLAEDNSLIIDEPELSMHIDWQRRLIESMRTLNPTAQLILATHSPDVMADVSDDKIFKL